VVYVTADGRIGTLSSSKRYKEEIEPMNQASETLFALKPVTFRYKKAIDPARLLSFGLIAEEVAEISPELITRDKEGKPATVRYEAVNAMLLNEFLKEHRKGEHQDREIEEQGARIAEQQKQIQALMAMVKKQAAQIQKMSARLELNKAIPQIVSE
jgi:septal ring factor EnvC (AmiA/AmiB activator)